MKRTRDTSNIAISVLAALAVLVQSFLLAWSASAAQMQPTLDQFGNPLCITRIDHEAAGDRPGQNHGDIAKCCAIGCLAGWNWGSAPPDDAPSFLVTLPHHQAARRPVALRHERRPLLGPHGPRAPPAV